MPSYVRSAKVVVVDDSEIARETAREILEEAGYEVTPLDSPFLLSRVMQQERPDLVLVDMQMPALRGDDAIGVILSHRLHTCPLVLHSDRPVSELQAAVQRCGASGFIRKTSDAALFLEQVGQFLRAGAQGRDRGVHSSRGG